MPDPPPLSYRVEQLDKLVRDWEDGSLLVMAGVKIPICYWQRLYKRTRPNVWKKIKDQWTKYKFIVGAIKSAGDVETFWMTMPFRPTTNPLQKRPTIKGISAVLREMRQEKDKRDAQAARQKFNGEEFEALFSYRKAGKTVVMTKDQDIARSYRRHIEKVEYWDEEPPLDDNDAETEIVE